MLLEVRLVFLMMLFSLMLYDNRRKPLKAGFSPKLLHSRFEYKSSAGPSSKMAPLLPGLGKSKFKPSLKS